MKTRIDPRIRARLEELGIDVVRAKLVSIMSVRTFAQDDDLEPLGHSLSATRKDMQQWLDEKAVQEIRWVRVGTGAAVAAALIAFLVWIFPRGPVSAYDKIVLFLQTMIARLFR